MIRFPIAASFLVTALALAGCASDDGDGSTPSNGPYGTWRAIEIGPLVAGSADTTIEIGQDGTVNGNGGCNGYGGDATITGGAIEFGPLISTQMACEPAIMDQELAQRHACTADCATDCPMTRQANSNQPPKLERWRRRSTLKG